MFEKGKPLSEFKRESRFDDGGVFVLDNKSKLEEREKRIINLLNGVKYTNGSDIVRYEEGKFLTLSHLNINDIDLESWEVYKEAKFYYAYEEAGTVKISELLTEIEASLKFKTKYMKVTL